MGTAFANIYQMHEKHPSKIVDVANEYSIQAVGSVQAVALGCCQNWPQELRIWRQQLLGDGMAASVFSVINSLKCNSTFKIKKDML